LFASPNPHLLRNWVYPQGSQGGRVGQLKEQLTSTPSI